LLYRQYGVWPILQARQQLGEYRLVEEMYNADEVNLKSYFRMDRVAFDELLELTYPYLYTMDTNWRKSIKPRHRLAITLRYE